MAQQRFTPKELQQLTLGQSLALKAQREKNLATEIASVMGKLSGFEYNGQEILDTKLAELADGKAIAEWNVSSPYSVGQVEREKKAGRVSVQGGVLEVNNRLNNIFTEAGLNDKSGPQSSINNRLKQLLSTEEWTVYTGYKYFRGRAKKKFNENVHAGTKAVLARLNAQGKKAERDFLGFKYFSGIRMSDMGDFEVSGYDPVMGTLTFIEGKSKGKPTEEKTVILRPASRPFLESAIAGREKGTIFVDYKKLTSRVNAELKDDLPTVTGKDSAGNPKEKNFTMGDYRDLEEGILLEAGLDKDERLFAAGRVGSDEASKYIEDEMYYEVVSPKLLKADAKLVAYSETKNAVQYFKEIGFDEGQLPDELKSVIIAKDLVTSPRYKKMLGKEFLDGLPTQGGGLKATNEDGTTFVFKSDPVLEAGYTEFAVGDYAKKTVENKEAEALGTIRLAKILQSDEFAEATKVLDSKKTTTTKQETRAPIPLELADDDLDDDIVEALKELGDRFKKVRQATPSLPQGLEALDIAVEAASTKTTPGSEETQMDKLFKYGRQGYKVGRGLYGLYQLRKGIQQQLAPSEEGQPKTLYDFGNTLYDQVQDAFSSPKKDEPQPTVQGPSMSPVYDKTSEVPVDTRPLNERLTEYQQFMRGLREKSQDKGNEMP